jgi:hypothetical protein
MAARVDEDKRKNERKLQMSYNTGNAPFARIEKKSHRNKTRHKATEDNKEKSHL